MTPDQADSTEDDSQFRGPGGDSNLVDAEPLDHARSPMTTESMLQSLEAATSEPFTTARTDYDSFVTAAELAVQEHEFYGVLYDLHEALRDEFVVGRIRAIDAWSDGQSEFRFVRKPWDSVIDKLYRINIEENNLYSLPPQAMTIYERAAGAERPEKQRWITPGIAHEVADDLLRTKFVVPFVDGVVDVSERITGAINSCGLLQFRRFHAKDSGYHARHLYVLIPVPQPSGEDTMITLEIKVLTKLQDALGELTHLLYEKHRTGEIPLQKKRKLAWQLGSPDFLATYLGHGGHLLEAAVSELKAKILTIEAESNG